MKLKLTLFSIGLALALAACAPAPSAFVAPARAGGVEAASLTGDIRHHREVASKHLTRKRDVWVYLPPGYSKRERYPVLYLHDGNNVFDGSQAFGGHEWGADESAERLIKSGQLPPLIMVAVANTPDRMAEYTWVAGLLGGEKQGGNGQAYARFLVEELKPFIDRTYSTRPGRADTGVMGSSLGGLISLYLGRHHGDTFGKLGVMSPSVWWSDRAVLAEADAMPQHLRIWLDFGHKEGKEPQAALENARALKRRLEARGYQDGKNLKYFEDQEGGHDERAWAYRVPMALQYMFGGK